MIPKKLPRTGKLESKIQNVAVEKQRGFPVQRSSSLQDAVRLSIYELSHIGSDQNFCSGVQQFLAILSSSVTFYSFKTLGENCKIADNMVSEDLKVNSLINFYSPSI